MKSIFMRGEFGLFVSASIIAVIWLIILPACAGTPQFQEYKTFLEERNINPEAMYYSDLESMPDVQIRINDAWKKNDN